MRERQWVAFDETGMARITPAYAGKTGGFSFYRVESQDHPRVRGKDSNRSPILSHSSDPHQRNFFTFVESA